MQSNISILNSNTDSIKSQITTINSNLTSIGMTIITLNSLTSSLKTDITDKVNQLQSQIDNVNNVNIAQNADIQQLKNTIYASGISAQMCKLIFDINGYCSKVNSCCQQGGQQQLYYCIDAVKNTIGTPGVSHTVTFNLQANGITSSQCGTFTNV
ncbi:Hypothetical_protein [Hexamita inflata]|uniref:Hypothetical_protein n=1 Tax=Hexamita inflata TaxID=28002 RepID=A0AA86P9C6_9EUKA|nr:Hypothetical protein HINF_LOCUS20966 [Hexamita inflata]